MGRSVMFMIVDLKNKKSKSRRMPKMCAIIPQLVSAQLLLQHSITG